MVYQRKRRGQKIWWVKVSTRAGGWVSRSTGTTDRDTARAIERMVVDLGNRGKRDWEILEADISLATIYDYYRLNDLDGLRARLKDVDLAPHVARWKAWLEGRVVADTLEHYETHLETLIPPKAAFMLSDATAEAVDGWLAGLGVSSSTKRKYLAAASSFFGYLVDIKVMLPGQNPVRDIKPPKASKPRVHFLELEEVTQVLERVDEPYQSLLALLYGTGIDVSTALTLTPWHVRRPAREILAPGTKTYNRRRVVRVAEWAWGYVDQLLEGKLPRAKLFPGMNRYRASDVHRAAAEAAGFPGYQMRDSRHHWAVRAARAGTPPEIIARQLGHANPVMVLKVYGVFFPDSQDREKWERIATAQDEARRAER